MKVGVSLSPKKGHFNNAYQLDLGLVFAYFQGRLHCDFNALSKSAQPFGNGGQLIAGEVEHL